MGLIDELRGSRICIDSAPFIYFIEKDPKYLNTMQSRLPSGSYMVLIRS